MSKSRVTANSQLQITDISWWQCLLQAGFIDQAAWALMSAAVQEQKDKLARLQREAKSKHKHVESHVLQANSDLPPALNASTQSMVGVSNGSRA